MSINSNKVSPKIQFMRYDEFKLMLNCEENKKIIDDSVDTNPIVPSLIDRHPISLSCIIHGSGKKKFKIGK